MGWSLGYDTTWKRDIGYGVPAFCDHPNCNAEIDRGLSHVCGGEPFGGERGCGLYFCEQHLAYYGRLPQLCERCAPRIKTPFKPSREHPVWIRHKLNDSSWRQWREENPAGVESLQKDDEA